MYFHRIPHPANFRFAPTADPAAGTLALGETPPQVRVEHLGADVHRLRVEHSRWQPHGSRARLTPELSGAASHVVRLTADGAVEVASQDTGERLLQGVPQATFGVSGRTWMFQFRHEPDMQFYGLGEHSRGLEKSGQRVKFWNTDLFGDFAHCEIEQGYANPMYVAIPWLIVKRGNRYVGLLVNNPEAVFMELASNFIWSDENPEDRARRSFYLGAPGGAPELYVLVGPDLPALLRKLQTLVGRTPLPPLWALGHHQCRWGYAGPDDLVRLDRAYREHGIPCDGLWLDIDYMERYKVFTFAPEHWRDADHVRRTLAALARRGRRVVPIIDPGVKVEPGYAICEDGLRRGLFCLNREGQPFVGFVWPGRTHFPDFSLPEAQAWWAERVREFVGLGFAGAWIDMNDPAVGAVELDDMLFGRGEQPHASYHNQYGLGMAEATYAGLRAARSEERPFLLSRSAFHSSSRYGAVWLGDNVSNWHHLRLAIPLSLGLALSGLPFNGPDVGGFMQDTTPELAVAWYKAGFLFPFLRNHSNRTTRDQEPWALGRTAGRVIAHYIRLRYKLLPYLYQLFVAHEETGAAIQRPLFHDFVDTPELPLGRIDEQFMIGPALMQAPIVDEGATERCLVLPGPDHWFSAQTGRWEAGGRLIVARAGASDTPLFVREGALVPMQEGERTDNRNDLARIELHCFLRRGTRVSGPLHYVADDGATFAYQRGERTRVTFAATVRDDGTLAVAVTDAVYGYRPLRLRLVVYDTFRRVVLVDSGRERVLPLAAARWRFTGRPLSVRCTPPIVLGRSRVTAPTARRPRTPVPATAGV